MDPEIKKNALRSLTYGLYVLTTADAQETAAGAVNWLSQASFAPPLVMVALRADSRLCALVQRSGVFAVNVLSSGQQEMASAFFKPSKIEGDRINGYVFERGPQTHAPILRECPAWFEARVVDRVSRGDHTVFVAEVIEAGAGVETRKALVMWDTGWFYGG